MAIKEAMFLFLFIVSPVAKEAKEYMKPRMGATLARDAGSSGNTCSTDNCVLKCCPAHWMRFGESCYHADDTITTKWSDARALCQNLGGDLVAITSTEENDFVYQLAMEQETVTEGKAWIGLKKSVDDSNWYWVDGTPLEGQYENWGSGEPNNAAGLEDCGHFFNQPGTWNDAPCELTEGWAPKGPTVVCERHI